MFDGGQGGNRLIGCLHPFKTAQVDCELPEGQTIEEMILAAGGDRALIRHGHCWLVHPKIEEMGSNGMVYIPRENWRMVRPKPGFTVQIRIVPGDSRGGKDPLRMILVIAVMVAAVIVSQGALAPLLGAGFAAGTVGAAVAGAVVPLAGPLFIGGELPSP